MTSQDEKREPFVSVRVLIFTGGALIWAANQNWLQMAEFYEAFVQGWRDFLREVWTSVIAGLHLPFHLKPHQKDVLSLNAILLGSAAYRIFFGKPTQPLFFPSARKLMSGYSKRYPRIQSILHIGLVLTFMCFCFLLYLLVLLPFVDTVRFSHDIEVLFTATFFAVNAYTLRDAPSRIVSYFGALFRAVRQHNWKYLSEVGNSLLMGVLALIIAAVVLISAIALLDAVGVTDAIKSLVNPHIDPNPFDPSEYFGLLFGESGLDLVLISISAALLYFTSGKSLKPLAQFVVLGAFIVVLGWISGVVVESQSSAHI